MPESPAAVDHLVVVEDDEVIGELLRRALVEHGYRVTWCRSGEQATVTVEADPAELVLLDVGLPDTDGFTWCRSFRRRHPEVPVVLVTARDAEIDIVVGLDAGASDYVTKPFSTNVLLARVRAHLRRNEVADRAAVIERGALRVDPRSYRATVGDQVVDLRPKEFELLAMLAREADRVVTRDRAMAEVWDLHWDTSSKTLDMHVSALRRKLGDGVRISTVRGVGYRLETP